MKDDTMGGLTLKPVQPGRISRVGGFLGGRFGANTEMRLKNGSLVEEFVSMYERKDRQDWFWIGEQVGKWLDGAAYACAIAGDDELGVRVLDAIDRLAESQEEDGYLGITPPWYRTPVRGMQLYEWYFVLHGLLACHEVLGSERALDIAARLGRFIMQTWGVEPGQFPLMGRFPGNGHDGGEGTLILEPMVRLGMRTGKEAFIAWSQATLGMWDVWAERYPESRHTGSYAMMRKVADGEAEVHEVRENVHAHTLHMTLLGIAALFDATGEDEYRRVVLGCIDRIRDTCVFLTGGMSSGERYVPHRYYNPKNDIEVCPQHTWVLLCDKALNWTGKPGYAEEIERTFLNNFLAAQRADGSNWHYMIPMNRPARPTGSPNCCNSSGARLVGRMPTFFYSEVGGGLAVHQYCDSEVVFTAGDADVKLVQHTSYPSEGGVDLEVRPSREVRFPLYLRVASSAKGCRITLAGESFPAPESVSYAEPGTYAVVNRTWRAGDRITLDFPMPIRVQAGSRQLAVLRGPLVYAYFQAWQDDPERFHWSQGVYPDDVELVVDPDDPSGSFTEDTAPEGCVGPALKVRAFQKPRAPMFANPEANRRLPGEREFEARLVPFVNQGAQQGLHAVFLDYRRSR